MKKLLSIIVLSLLLQGCSAYTVGKPSVTEVVKLGSTKNSTCKFYFRGKEFLTTHVLCNYLTQKNYEYDTVNKTELIWNGVSEVFFIFENVNVPLSCSMKRLGICKFGDGTLRKITFNINEAKDWMNNDFAKAEKEKEIAKAKAEKEKEIAKAKKEKELKKKKKQNTSLSNNTLNRSFICSYKFNSSERSKIKIRGGTATEITAAGISINYSVVELTSKGAFALEGSSKYGRTWFIGAKSFLILGVEMIPYNCN